ncbi:Chromosome partition protein Smc [Carpediemonas membranifera]|uniref:Chromosome partition protein Smc n=1 Tax=Carpediemonas membranifera TaxID=201153 RepID=A0A8J6AR30_9EUKA|nr:Chromosome partition protein Smc [Carpediemonas membranifera]|eukprot:KAG9391753.1 Chromosome partition protein Smc [Carpediemonas membranifera]
MLARSSTLAVQNRHGNGPQPAKSGEDSVSELKEQIAGFTRQIRELVDSNSSLKSQLYSAEVDQSLHKIEVAALKKENSKLASDNATLQESRSDMEAETYALKAQLEQLAEERDEAKVAMARSAKSLRRESSAKLSSEQAIGDYIARITALEAELKARDEDDANTRASNAKKLAEVDNRTAQLDGTIAELEAKLAESTREAETLRAEVAKYSEREAVCSGERGADEMQAEIERLRTSLNTSENAAAEKIAALQHEIELHDRDEPKIAARIAELEAAVANSQSELDQTRDELEDVRATRADISAASLADLKTQLESAQAERDQAKIDANVARSSLKQYGSDEESTKKTIDDYVARITALEAELKARDEDDANTRASNAKKLAEVDNRTAQLDGTIAELEAKLAESTREAETLRAEVAKYSEREAVCSGERGADEMQAEIERLRTSLNTSENAAAEKIAALQHEIELHDRDEPKIAARIAELEAAVANSQSELDQTRDELEDVRATRADISAASLADLKTQLESAQAERDQAKIDANVARSSLKQYGSDEESTKKTIDDYVARITALEAELKARDEDDANTRASNAKKLAEVDNRTAQLDGTIAELEAKLAESTREAETLRAEVAKYSEREAVCSGERGADEMQAEIERLRTSLNTSENAAAEKIAALQHEIELHDRDEPKIAARIAELEAAVANSQSELDQTRDELEDVRATRADISAASLADLKTQLESAQAERDQAKIDANVARSSLKQYGSDEESTKKTIDDYVARITALEAELKARDEDDANTRASNAKKLAEVDNRTAQLDGTIAELEAKLAESTREAETLRAEVAKYSEREAVCSGERGADEMQAEIERLRTSLNTSENAAAEKIAALQHEIELHDRDEPKIAARIAELEAAVANSQSELDQTRDELEDVRATRADISAASLADLKTQLESAQAERDQAKIDANVARSSLKQYGSDEESTKKTIDDYVARITALEAELKARDEDDANTRASNAKKLAEVDNRTAQLDGTIAELEAKLAESTREAETLRAEVAKYSEREAVCSGERGAYEMQAEIERLRTSLNTSENAAAEKIAALQHEIELHDRDEPKIAARIAELEAAVANSQSELIDAQAELTEVRPRLTKVTQERDVLKAQLTHYKRNNDTAKDVDDGATARIEALEHELAVRDRDDVSKQAEVDRLLGRLDELQRALEVSQTIVAEKQTEIDALDRARFNPDPAIVGHKESHERAMAAAADRIAMLERELQAVHGNAEANSAGHAAALEQEAKQRRALEADLDAVKAQLAAAQEDTAAYRASLLSAQDTESASDLAAVTRARELAVELEQQSRFHQDQLAEKARVVAELQDKVDAAQAEVEAARGDVLTLQAHAEQGRSGHANELTALAREKAQLERALAEASQTVLVLQNELTAQSSSANTELKALDEKVKFLSAELEQTQIESEKAVMAAEAKQQAADQQLRDAQTALSRFRELSRMSGLKDIVTEHIEDAHAMEEEAVVLLTPQPPSTPSRSTPSIPVGVQDSLRYRESTNRRMMPESPRPPVAGRPRRVASFLSRHVQRADMAETEREELNAAREHAADIEYQQNIRKTVVASDRMVAELVDANEQMAANLGNVAPDAVPDDVPGLGHALVAAIGARASFFPDSLASRVVPALEDAEFAQNVARLAAALTVALERAEVAELAAIAADAREAGAINLMLDLIRTFRSDFPTLRAAIAKPVPLAVAVFAMHCLSSLSLLEDAEQDIVSEANRDAVSVVMSFVPENEVLLVLTDPLLLSSVATALHVLSSVATCSAGRAVLGAPGPVGFLSRLLDLEGDSTAAVMARRSACRCLRNIALPGGATNGAIELDTLTKLVCILRTDSDVETLRFATHLMALALRSRRNQQPDFVESMLDMMSPHLTSPDTETCRNAISCLLVLSSTSVSTVTRPDIVAKLPVVLYTHSDPKPVVMALSTIERVIRIGGVGFDSIAHVQGHPLLPKLVNYLVGPSEDLACKASKILVHFYTAPKEGEERAGFEARVAEFVGTATADNTPALTALSQKLPELMSTTIIDHLVAVATIVAGISTVPACMDEMVSMGIIPLVRGLLSKTFGPTDAFFHQSEGEYPSAAMSTASVRGRSKNTSMHRTAIILAIARNLACDDARLAQLVDVESPVERLGLDTMMLVAAHAAEPAVADISIIAVELLCTLVAQGPVAAALGSTELIVEGKTALDAVIDIALDHEAINALTALCTSAPKARKPAVVRALLHAALDDSDAEACMAAVGKLSAAELAGTGVADLLVKLSSGPAGESAVRLLATVAEEDPAQCEKAGVLDAVIAAETEDVKSEVDSIIVALYKPGNRMKRVLTVIVDRFMADLATGKWTSFGDDFIAAMDDVRAIATDDHMDSIAKALQVARTDNELTDQMLDILEVFIVVDPSAKKPGLTADPANLALASLPEVASFLESVKKLNRKVAKGVKAPKSRATDLLALLTKSKSTSAQFKVAMKSAATG